MLNISKSCIFNFTLIFALKKKELIIKICALNTGIIHIIFCVLTCTQYIGGLTKPKQAKSVIGLFRRESSTASGGGDDTPGTPVGSTGTPVIGRAAADKRSASVCGPLPLFNEIDPLGAMRPHHAGQFPVTASHRRNNRRASMLEMSG